MGNRVLFLVRHGQYETALDAEDGQDGGLNPVGRLQAAMTGERLKDVPFTAIYHSTLRRAAETTELIAEYLPGVPIEAEPLLRECIPGIPARDPQLFEHTPPDMIANGLAQAEAAYTRFFRRVVGEDRYNLLICHGNIIRYFACRALDAPIELWANMDIYNCSVTEILIEPTGRMTLISLNDSGHLPQELRS